MPENTITLTYEQLFNLLQRAAMYEPVDAAVLQASRFNRVVEAVVSRLETNDFFSPAEVVKLQSGWAKMKQPAASRGQ